MLTKKGATYEETYGSVRADELKNIRSKGKRENLVNQVFGFLMVIDLAEKRPNYPNTDWLCKCVCGKEKIVNSGHLKRGAVTSCGCQSGKHKNHRQKKNENNKPHNWTGHGDISGAHWARLKRRENKKAFEITIEYAWNIFLNQNKKCVFTGEDIYFGDWKSETTASLDRIDNTKGYIEGNIQWVHKDINILKGSFSDQKLIKLCEAITNYRKDVLYDKRN